MDTLIAFIVAVLVTGFFLSNLLKRQKIREERIGAEFGMQDLTSTASREAKAAKEAALVGA